MDSDWLGPGQTTLQLTRIVARTAARAGCQALVSVQVMTRIAGLDRPGLLCLLVQWLPLASAWQTFAVAAARAFVLPDSISNVTKLLRSTICNAFQWIGDMAPTGWLS